MHLLASGRTLAQTPEERAYLCALSQGHFSPEPEDDRQQALNYAGAMRSLTSLFPNNQDAAALCAEALMLIFPGRYWSSAGQPGPHTQKILATLEGVEVLTQDPEHPGANHLYIHTSTFTFLYLHS
ncbi:MAG: hypothetical protein ACUVRV_13075 [Cyanobacteriota bacterium]